MTGSRWSGIVLLIVGVAFWIRDPFALAFQPDRWWALLLLVPVLALLVPRTRGDAGEASGEGGLRPGPGKIRVAGAIVGVMAVFLLTPDFGQGWPLLLVVYGLAASLA